MCGIIGYTGKKLAHSILIKGLKRLEYRGYDSYGFALVFSNPGMVVTRDIGQIGEANVDLKSGSKTGIAHTRWATHGGVTPENAHPQLSSDGKIAVVHNGILTNYLELQEYLTKRNHQFQSETDTETIPRLIEEFLKENHSILDALRFTVQMVDPEGSYAFAMVSEDHPNEVFFAKNKSPLLIGIGNNENFVGSAEIAFLEYTKKFIPLDDLVYGRVTSNTIEIFSIPTGERIDFEGKITISPWNLEEAQKGGYPHFMLKEIHDQPLAIQNTLFSLDKEILQELAEMVIQHSQTYLIAAGTSFHSCLVGEILFEKLAKVRARAMLPNDFCEKNLYSTDLVIGISQSGETADTMTALQKANQQNATITSIVNNVGTQIPRISQLCLYTYAGPEIGVAATKTFTTQVLALTKLAIEIGKLRGTLSTTKYQSLLDELQQLPQIITKVIKQTEFIIRKVATKIRHKSSMYYLGTASTIPIALEGALKLKEIAYVHAEGYNAAESKHGPIALIEKDFPVLFIAANDDTRHHLLGNIREMSARGAYTIVIHEGDSHLASAASKSIILPSLTNPELITIPASIILQLLAYYAAAGKIYQGQAINPDRPRNLAKSVTVV